MITTYTVIKVDGTLEQHEIDIPQDPGYSTLREIVVPHLGGHPMEHVSVLYDGKPADMFVDSDGQMRGLDRNVVATQIYRSYTLSKQFIDPEELPDVVGPAVLFDRRVWF